MYAVGSDVNWEKKTFHINGMHILKEKGVTYPISLIRVLCCWVWTVTVRAKCDCMHLLIHERALSRQCFLELNNSIFFLFLAIFNTIAPHLTIARSSEKIYLLLFQLSFDTESIFFSSAFWCMYNVHCTYSKHRTRRKFC